MSDASGALWDFAVRVYQTDGVSEACLALQERFAVDVNVLLFAAWTGAARGCELSRSDIAELRGAVRAWHDEIVRPLRAVRQRMKAGPPPGPSPATETLRTRLKAVEIEAERLELTTLEQIAGRFASPGVQGRGALAAANMREVVEQYGGRGVDAAARDGIDRIAAAAAQVATGPRGP